MCSMGSRGPAPTPTAILRANGSWRGDINANEPKPKRGVPKAPFSLKGKAGKAWKFLAPILDEIGVLTVIDGHALARYCVLWARWREAEDFLEKHGTTFAEKNKDGEVIGMKAFPQVKMSLDLAAAILRLEQSFGMSPSARSRIDASINGDEVGLDDFLNSKPGLRIKTG